MPDLRIFCDAPLSDRARELLTRGIAPHPLAFPPGELKSVLHSGPADEALTEADIAFGQPDVAGVLASRRLRWIQISSAGFTRYDTPEFRAAAKERGLLLTNSSSVYAAPCAEHVFAFMLAQSRQLPEGLEIGRTPAWSSWDHLRNRCLSLRGQQDVLILGFGAIARELVRLLDPFEVKITALRRQPRGDEGVAVVTPEKLEAALATADHIVNILPDNAESFHFISAERLAQMKPGAIFYNIGRGRTVDQEALAASLHSGHLGGAWLDVMDPEPLPAGHPLLRAPRCHFTPHCAGGHQNETETLVRHFLDNFQRFQTGSALRDRIM